MVIQNKAATKQNQSTQYKVKQYTKPFPCWHGCDASSYLNNAQVHYHDFRGTRKFFIIIKTYALMYEYMSMQNECI